MANVKISALPAATSVAAADVLPIVQSATTKKATFTDVAGAVGGVRVYASAAARNSAITSPTEGMCVYLTDEDTLQIYTGSAWVAVSATKTVPGVSDGMVYIASTTVTTSSQIIIDNCFTSTYRHYRVHFDTTAYSANNTVQLQMRTGGSSGSNYTSLNYQFQLLEASNTTVTASQAVSNDWWRITYGYSTGYISATIDVFNPYETANTQYQSFGRSNNGTTSMLMNNCTGFMNATESFTGLRIYSSSNITGRVTVYGYRN